MGEGVFVLAAGALVAGTLLASIVAGSLRLPALVLFMGVGMVAGSDGAKWISFDNYDVARQIGTAALCLIMFEGGLTTSFADLRPMLRPAIGLAVVGTIVTALLTGVVATVLLGLPLLHGLLLGSILASTDGAAVFAMLRGSGLPKRVVNTLEGEAGLNDPVAVLLVLGFIAWIETPGYGVVDMAGLFVSELTIGALAGLLVGRGAAEAMRRLRLPGSGLYPAGTIATAAIAYGAAQTLGGSGFLAVYLAGLMLSSTPGPAQMTITIFHDGAAWFAQVALFLTLGLLVFPSQLGAVWTQGVLLATFLMLVARPVAVAIATSFDRFTRDERLLLSWAGLRGGVPVVLATYPVIAGVSGSLKFFNVVFVAVVITTLVQGMTFEPLARWLGLMRKAEDAPTVAARAATVAARVGKVFVPPTPPTAPPVPEPTPHPVTMPVPMPAPAPLQLPQPLPQPAPAPAPTPQAVHGPWLDEHGDPAHPVSLHSIPVVEHVRTRRDAPGALVKLADGRLAITGATLTVAPAADLQRYVTRRLSQAVDSDERAWWTSLAVTLARSA
jgi:cell volume regulation protein A